MSKLQCHYPRITPAWAIVHAGFLFYDSCSFKFPVYHLFRAARLGRLREVCRKVGTRSYGALRWRVSDL
ncbi:MAG TPA: hypothetical protein VNU95_01850 [Candidatus Acidoferrales bacterium]|nr:hypothetical protein [Candidatus Acidoferrales bacterium]